LKHFKITVTITLLQKKKQNLFESLKFTACTEGIEAVFAIYFPELIYNNPVLKWSLSSHKNKTIVFSIFQSSPEEYSLSILSWKRKIVSTVFR